MHNTRDIKSINKSIESIKDYMNPITMTSMADLYQNIIFDKGTSKEGNIMTFNQANEKYIKTHKCEMDRAYYDELLQDLKDDFDDQLTLNGALKYARSRLEQRYEEFENQGIPTEELDKMSNRKLVKLISDIGQKVNEDVRNGKGTSDNFYSMLMDELGIEE